MQLRPVGDMCSPRSVSCILTHPSEGIGDRRHRLMVTGSGLNDERKRAAAYRPWGQPGSDDASCDFLSSHISRTNGSTAVYAPCPRRMMMLAPCNCCTTFWIYSLRTRRPSSFE